MKAKEQLKEEFNKKILEVSAIVKKLDGDIDYFKMYQFKKSKDLKVLAVGNKKELAFMLIAAMRNSSDIKDVFDLANKYVQALKEE